MEHKESDKAAALSEELLAWKKLVGEAVARFREKLASEPPSDAIETEIAAHNAKIKTWLEIAEANELIGHGFKRADLKAVFLENWPERTLSLAEERMVRTAWAYGKQKRLKAAGPKDGPLVAAMQVAAALEGMVGENAAETVRKSIQRHRTKNKDTMMLRLDPDTLLIELVRDHGTATLGLPNRTGRPETRKK